MIVMSSASQRNLLHSLVSALVIVGGICTIISLQIPKLNSLKVTTQEVLPETWQQEEKLIKSRLATWQQIPTFGFDNLFADWVFIEFLEYFGDEEARQVTGYKLSPDYFQVVVDKDPRFRQAYLFLFVSNVMYAGMPERSLDLIEQGLQSMTPEIPDRSYFIWRNKGATELLFLNDSQAAQESYAKAAEWASTYPDNISQNVASLSRRTAEFLATNPDSKPAQISSWLGVLETAVDEKTRTKAIQRIKELGGKIEINPDGSVKVQLPQ